jgi:hypothetical protein
MDEPTLPIIPFGKYKGQPITSLLSDAEYLTWCKQQEWFQKYTVIYNICVNQTITTNTQGSKTPEHNKLQNLFLDREFKFTFIDKLFGINKTLEDLSQLYKTEEYIKYFGEQRFNTDEPIGMYSKFETDFNWDVCLTTKTNYGSIDLDIKYWNEKFNIYNTLFSTIKNVEWNCKSNRYNEDKECWIYISLPLNKLYIEVKPLIGDDYPNVLRKMTTQIKLTETSDKNRGGKLYILFVKEFLSSTTTKEQFVQIFNQSNIRVLFLDDITHTGSEPNLATSSLHVKDTKEIILEEKLVLAENKIKELEATILSLKKQLEEKSTPIVEKEPEKGKPKPKTIKSYFDKN